MNSVPKIAENTSDQSDVFSAILGTLFINSTFYFV